MINWLHTLFEKEGSKPSLYTKVGSPMKDEFLLEYAKDGTRDLKKVGESNLYEKIQSHKDSVDIYKLLDRYRNGDLEALDSVKGQYMDIVDAPKTLAESYRFVNNASEFFKKLPLEVRSKYDHNPSKFISAFGTDDFTETMKSVFKDDHVDVIVQPVETVQPAEPVGGDDNA